MIPRAIYALLSTDNQIESATGGRIKPIRFDAGTVFPIVQYSTEDVQRIPCRHVDDNYFGTVEVIVLATEYGQLCELVSNIRRVMDNFDGVSAGYSLAIEPGVEGPDQEDPDLGAYFKPIRFEVTASPI